MTPLRVVKIGGSLLQLPDLPSRLNRWRAHLQSDDDRACRNVFVMGGGKICDHVRELDRRFSFSESQSHTISIELMGGMSKMAQALFNLEIVHQIDSIAKQKDDFIFDCRRWIANQPNVPHSWSVTSDSIAALLAKEISAKLVLFKSTDNPLNLVDAYFKTASNGLPDIQIVNLADKAFSCGQ